MAPGAPNPPRDRVRELLGLSIASGVAGLLLGIAVLALGSKGDKLLTVLTLALAVAVPVGERLLDAWLAEGNHRIRLPRGRRKWTLIVVFALAFWIVGYGTWPLWHKTDINVTDQVKIVGGDEMRGGTDAHLTFPISQKRDWLALRLRLENKTPSGMCVGRARLRYHAIADGVTRKNEEAGPGEEVRVHLGEVARSVHVEVTVIVPDEGCAFKLTAEEAVFYNRRLPW